MWTLYEGDCFDYFHLIDDGSIDMVLCDLPYGSTACKWDTPLPLDKLWSEYERIIKPNGAIVLTASQPFTTTLISSNKDLFRYSWVWIKTHAANFPHAKNMPLKLHEDICIFSKGKILHKKFKNRMNYNPQGIIKVDTMWRRPKKYDSEHKYKRKSHKLERIIEFKGYPGSVLKFPNGNNYNDHPTQKPVALFEYLIRTYTNPGDLVLDNCAGSGTTGVACENTGRNSILMEKEPEYCQIIRDRLNELSSQTRLKVEA